MSTSSMKQILFFTLMSFTMIMTPLAPNTIAHCYHQDPSTDAWKYLEFYFVVEPNNQLQALSMTLSVQISALVSGLFLLSKIIPSKTISHNNLEINVDRISIDSSTLITSSILAAAAGYWYNLSKEQEIRKNTLITFLNNWSYHRNFIPEELVEAFDELAKNFNQFGYLASDSEINKIFSVVQHLIEHTFEKRYSKDKKGVDLLGSIKTITDIGKNLSPSK